MGDNRDLESDDDISLTRDTDKVPHSDGNEILQVGKNKYYGKQVTKKRLQDKRCQDTQLHQILSSNVTLQSIH